ncbi:MAG: TIM barrel protein [Acidobacteria bacterium]|nr:TIM barrel protein [Acidobacteriota bacterium]MYD70769.1 TIM barrel protein [Acidobacteriota bacterium]
MAELTRREAMGMVGVAAVGAAVGPSLPAHATAGALRQSVCRWCFSDIPLRDFFGQVRASGLTAVDLLDEEEWAIAREHGLACSTGYGGGGTISDGLNDPANHKAIVRNLARSLPAAARAGVPNVIAFFGNRRGLSDAQGVDHCVTALRRIAPIAESEDVTVVVELLNSRVDHPDYQGDRTSFGVEVVKRVASPRVKLLYDVYHMQVMEGNVIQTIRDNHQHIGHYHTAGVPGRHELDRQQELQWPAIARAIAETGFRGYLAHEFIPTRDPMTSLREAVASCRV